MELNKILDEESAQDETERQACSSMEIIDSMTVYNSNKGREIHKYSQDNPFDFSYKK